MAAKGSAEWNGDLKSGSGKFTAGDSIGGEYSFGTRFEDAPGANPEQLIAAAHSSCFSMALSLILGEDGVVPDSIKTDASVQIRMLEDQGPTITRIDLTCRAVVPGIDAAAFQQAAEAAKGGCPVSKALAGVPEINLDASLVPA
ncbi:MAG: OsmC family peroxiredoxin [Solirubrobacterales bacterium]|nr:OsmC family peroxiredoxin [Solirubrobacterales bacterium]